MNVTKELFNDNYSKRIVQKKESPCTVWFTGLSGSGKSTLAKELEKELLNLGLRTYILDGDNVRKGINNDLSFTARDRSENIRRIAEIAALFLDAGVVVIVACISPYKKDRDVAKSIIGENNFIEVHVNAPLEVCELRDVKGLYKKARKGEIKNFTGITAPYEIPTCPSIEINTDSVSIHDSVHEVLKYLKKHLVDSSMFSIDTLGDNIED